MSNVSHIDELREAINEIVAQRGTANELIALIRTVFTRGVVELLRGLILSGRQHWWFDVEEVESITDRIEALLPKEGAHD